MQIVYLKRKLPENWPLLYTEENQTFWGFFWTETKEHKYMVTYPYTP